MQHLQTTLQSLSDNQLFGKMSKCQFCQAFIEYLGHIISVVGVEPDPNLFISKFALPS